jgi:hypothetical protein
MMVNQFTSTSYRCSGSGESVQCMFPSNLEAEGRIRGTAVLDAYHISHGSGKVGEWVGILVSIIVAYRILGYLVLVIKKS